MVLLLTVTRAAIQAAQNPAQMATQTGASSPAPATPGLFPLQQPSSPYETPGSGSTNSPNNNNNNDNIILPHNLLYSRYGTISSFLIVNIHSHKSPLRLSLFLSLVTLSWFLTAHILQYTSLNTCRYTSPHVWWLTFGILCIMYLMVLEVILLGFIVLVVAPILFVFWNIFLFCIGRHPAQNPHMIKPDIGKLSKSIVDRIPLVMYIPPPPGSESNDNADNATTPTSPHAYPPISPSQQQQQPQTPPPKRSRFRFFKRKPSSKEAGATEQANGDTTNVDLEKGKVEQEVWEGNFEKGDYPFVVLEGNRAACAICLMDFEAPRRKDEVPPDAPTASSSSSPSRSPPPLADTNSAQPLKLTDSGEGAQPLRLLACGHVFHQTCLDPWLTDVSGRCPVCQRPVDVSELKKRKRRHR
ncbi:RING-7 protein [Coprinopsis cinerea AmutBmut pab1-1]|nr:RING-7 protein [Coprinopsis cinerea AmutBmut pab1-1]